MCLAITAWTNNRMTSMLDDGAYPLPNLSGSTADVECIINFIPQFIMDALTYPFWK